MVKIPRGRNNRNERNRLLKANYCNSCGEKRERRPKGTHYTWHNAQCEKCWNEEVRSHTENLACN